MGLAEQVAAFVEEHLERAYSVGPPDPRQH